MENMLAFIKAYKAIPGIKTSAAELYALYFGLNTVPYGPTVKKAQALAKKTGISEYHAFFVLMFPEFFSCATGNEDARENASAASFEACQKILRKHGMSNEDAVLIWGLCNVPGGNLSEKFMLDTARQIADAVKKGARKMDLFPVMLAFRKASSFQLNVLNILCFWQENGAVPEKLIIDALNYVGRHLGLEFLSKCGAASIVIYHEAHTKSRSALLPLIKYVLSKTAGISKEEMSEFLRDPALPYCEVLVKNGINPREALIYGRNLWFAKVPIATVSKLTIAHFRVLSSKRDEAAEKVKNISIFKNRHVVILKEREGDDSHDRFASQEMQKAIRISMGIEGKPALASRLKVCDTGKFGDTQEEREKVGREFLVAIVNTPPPATFFIESHGDPNGYSQFGITVDQIAAAFVARANLWSPTEYGPKLKEDILVSNSCFFHTVARKIMDKNPSVVKPMVIAGAEYGASGYTRPGQENFVYKVLRAGDEDPKIEDAILAEPGYARSDVSIYVQDSAGRILQIVENEQLKVEGEGEKSG